MVHPEIGSRVSLNEGTSGIIGQDGFGIPITVNIEGVACCRCAGEGGGRDDEGGPHFRVSRKRKNIKFRRAYGSNDQGYPASSLFKQHTG